MDRSSDNDSGRTVVDGNAFLAHYGVKGMKWGVRKAQSRRGPGGRDANGRLRPGQPRPKSHDHNQSRKLMKKKPSELSNKELKRLNERLEMEKKLRELKQADKDKIKSGHDRVKQVLGVAKTAQEIYSLANGPLGKAIRSAIK